MKWIISTVATIFFVPKLQPFVRGYIESDFINNMSHEFKTNEIFKASDLMVDSLTQLISKKRQKQQ